MPPSGRLSRLGKLASLGAKLSTDVVSRGVKKLAGSEAAEDVGLLGAKAAESLVSTLGEMKGLAMKMGQMMSMDPDLLSDDIRKVVAKLQNQAPPMPFETVRGVIRQELGGDVLELFASFDEQPLASASLGQVHRAVTKEGREVAVKVQYPDVDKAVQADLKNISSMVAVAQVASRVVDARKYFEEVRGELMGELDYRKEAERAKQYAEAVAAGGLDDLKVPEVFDSLSSGKVLTLELLPGRTLKDLLAQDPPASNEERFRVTRLLTRAIWGPFFTRGVIHADPHPGNFLVMPDGRLGVLDYGAVKLTSPTFQSVNKRMSAAVIKRVPYDVVALSHEVGFTMKAADDEVRPFIEGVMALVTRFLTSRDYDFGKDSTAKDLRAHFIKNATKLHTMQPPKEALMFFRGIGGLSQNMQNLRARGDFLSVYEELLPLAER